VLADTRNVQTLNTISHIDITAVISICIRYDQTFFFLKTQTLTIRIKWKNNYSGIHTKSVRDRHQWQDTVLYTIHQHCMERNPAGHQVNHVIFLTREKQTLYCIPYTSTAWNGTPQVTRSITSSFCSGSHPLTQSVTQLYLKLFSADLKTNSQSFLRHTAGSMNIFHINNLFRKYLVINVHSHSSTKHIMNYRPKHQINHQE